MRRVSLLLYGKFTFLYFGSKVFGLKIGGQDSADQQQRDEPG